MPSYLGTIQLLLLHLLLLQLPLPLLLLPPLLLSFLLLLLPVNIGHFAKINVDQNQ